MQRLFHEMFHKHLYFQVLSMEYGFKKTVKCLEILTNLTANMFLLAVFYDIQFPSDTGSCQKNLSQQSCLSHSSTLNPSQHVCDWVPKGGATIRSSTTPSDTSYTCVWLKPTFNPFSLIVITVFVVLLSCPIQVILSVIFDKILMQPTAGEVAKQEVTVSNRRKSVVSQVELHVDLSKQAEKKARPSMFSSSSRVKDKLVNLSVEAYESAVRSHVISKASHTSAAPRQQQNQLQVSAVDTLMTNLRTYARSLRGRELSRFRAQWPVLQESSKDGDDAAIDAIAREMDAVEMEAREWIRQLKKESPSFVGVKILDLFVQDLVGRSSRKAKVFENQSNAFKNQMIITWGVKCLALSLLVLLNGYFIFSCMLYGRDKGINWQRGWLMASMANLFIDVMIEQVNIVLIVHYFIPNAIFETVHVVKGTIHSTVEKMCKITAGERSANYKPSFSASDYLFVSHRVAKAFPESLESALVLSYHSSAVCTEQSALWKNVEGEQKSSRYAPWLLLAIALNNFVLYIGSQAVPVQSLIVACLNPLIVAAMAFMGTAILHSKIFGVCIGFGIVFAVVLLFLYWVHKRYDHFATDKSPLRAVHLNPSAVVPIISAEPSSTVKAKLVGFGGLNNQHGDDSDRYEHGDDDDAAMNDCSVDVDDADLFGSFDFSVDCACQGELPAIDLRDLSLPSSPPDNNENNKADLDISLNGSSLDQSRMENCRILPIGLDQLSLPPSASNIDEAQNSGLDLSLYGSIVESGSGHNNGIVPVGLDQLSLPPSELHSDGQQNSLRDFSLYGSIIDDSNDVNEGRGIIPIGLDQLSLPSLASQVPWQSQISPRQSHSGDEFFSPSDQLSSEHDERFAKHDYQVVRVNIDDLSLPSSSAASIEGDDCRMFET